MVVCDLSSHTEDIHMDTHTFGDVGGVCSHRNILKGHGSFLANTYVWNCFLCPFCDGIKIMVEGYFIAVNVLFLITFIADYMECTSFYSLFVR